MITVIYSIPTKQFTEEIEENGKTFTRKRLTNSKLLHSVGTRSMCEAMVSTVEEVIDTYYDEDILGAWQENGLPIGYEYVTQGADFEKTIEQRFYPDSLDRDGNVRIQPIRTVEFNKADYISYLPDVVKHDDGGKEVSRTKQTKLKFIFNWGGWKEKVVL
jgi:hypothetical protein